MSDTFPYYDKKTGQIIQRPTQPNFFQKAYESAAYDESIDTQRANYNKAQQLMGTPDKSSAPSVPDDSG